MFFLCAPRETSKGNGEKHASGSAISCRAVSRVKKPTCLTYCAREAWAAELDIYITRSRPYKKNDQATVESKNNHIVRQYAV